MRHFVVILAMGLAGLAAGAGFGFGHEVLAEMPLPETVSYDCKREDFNSSMIACICLRGQEMWVCTMPIPQARWGTKGKVKVK